MVGPKRPVFVLFGSSIVVQSFAAGGWGAMLADAYACKADIVLRGYHGWNSKRGVEVLDEIFPQDSAVLQPSLVIVYFGGNDSIDPHPSGLGPHVPIPEYIENIRKIATHLKSLSEKIIIIFLSCPPINEQKFHQNRRPVLKEIIRTNERSRQYSEACVQICKEMKVEAVDLWTAIRKRDDWAAACFSDGIHLSHEGSKIVFDEIMQVLKDRKLDPPLHCELLQDEFAEEKPYDLNALISWCFNAYSTN